VGPETDPSGERLVAIMRPHVRSLLVPFLALLIIAPLTGLLIGLVGNGPRSGAARTFLALLAAAALVRWVVFPFAAWFNTQLVLTESRVVVRGGLFERTGRDVPLTRLTEVTYTQGVIERVLGSGTITISSIRRNRPRPRPVPREDGDSLYRDGLHRPGPFEGRPRPEPDEPGLLVISNVPRVIQVQRTIHELAERLGVTTARRDRPGADSADEYGDHLGDDFDDDSGDEYDEEYHEDGDDFIEDGDDFDELLEPERDEDWDDDGDYGDDVHRSRAAGTDSFPTLVLGRGEQFADEFDEFDESADPFDDEFSDELGAERDHRGTHRRPILPIRRPGSRRGGAR